MARSVLQEELRKKHPFSSLEQEATLNLVRSADHLMQDFQRLYHEHGISGPQYNVLRILRGHGGSGLACSDIAAQMVTRMPDITRLVDRLEEAGLVGRSRSSSDRRVVRVTITASGLELLARLDQPVLRMHAQQMQHLSRAELAELNRLLVKVRRPDA